MPPGRSTLSVASAAAIGLFLLLLYAIRQILLPFAIAGIVAFVCAPLADWLADRTRLPRWCFALALLVAMIFAVAMLAATAIPQLLHETARLGGDLEGEVKRLIQGLLPGPTSTLPGASVDPAQLAHSVVAALRAWLGGDKMLTAVAWGFSAFFGAILTGVLLAYFLLDTRRIAQGLFWLIPPGRRPFARLLWSKLEPVLRRYFVGIAAIVLYAAAAAYIGLGLILHLHHAGLLALLTGVLELLPVVGPGASALIGGIVAVQEATGAWNILAYAIYAVALRVSIDQLLGPLVLGRATHVQPPLVIFCFLTGGVLLGITGIILAVPVALGIKIALAIRYADEDASPT